MKVHDEACGMDIDPETAAAKVIFQDKTYYFCSERCRGMFVEHPERYVPIVEEGGQPEGPGDHHHHH